MKLFEDKYFNRQLYKLALPIALQELMLALVAAADALMLGKLDQDAMTAVSLATQIQFVQLTLLFSVVEAISALAAQYWGKKDKKSAFDIMCIGLRVSTVVCFAFFAGSVFFPQMLMTLMTNSTPLIDIGVSYLKIAGWSYLIVGISRCYLCMMKIYGCEKQAAVISTTTVVLNIVINAILIFGLFGIPSLGVTGAAIATVVSRVIELIWCITFSLTKGHEHPSLKALFTRVKTLSADFARTAIPLCAAGMLWSIGFASYSAFIGHLGEDVAAANSVASVVRDLVCCLCNGISAGGGIIVGFELGKGNLEKGKEYGIKLAKMSFLCGGASTVIMVAVTPLLLAFVQLTEVATHFLLWMMLIMAFYMIGRAVNTVIINGIFAAGGDTKFDFVSLIIVMWCLAVPLAALGTFVFNWNPLVVYCMTCLDEVGKIPLVIIHFRRYKWVKDLTHNRDDMLAQE